MSSDENNEPNTDPVPSTSTTSNTPPPTTSTTQNTLTPDQEQLVSQLAEICGQETPETCRRALERHSWNLETAVMELIAPEPTATITPTPPTMSNSFPNFDDTLDDTDDEQLQAQGAPAPPPPRVPQQAHSDNVLRRRRVPTQATARTYAETVRAARRGGGHPAGGPRSIIERLLDYAVRFLVASFNIPVSILQRLGRFLPTAPIGGTGSRLSAREEVIKSVAMLKDKIPEFSASSINILPVTYTEALTKSRTEVKVLVCLVICWEHEETFQFLRDVFIQLVPFIESNDALLWVCNLDSVEGDRAASELCVHRYPCLNLLLPASSARVNVVQRIYKAENFERINEAMVNHSGELVVLKDEKRVREGEQRLRREQ